MKKIKLFALMGVVALTSTLAFTSCKKDKNDPAEQNGVREEVKTEFSISIPLNQANGARKMRGTNVQVTPGSFLGMENINLIPFSRQDSIHADDSRLGANIVIPATLGTAELNVVNTSKNEKSKLYTNVSIPVGTGSFLFYGNATKGSLNDFEAGKTEIVNNAGNAQTISAATTPADINFKPSSIHGEGNTKPTHTVGTALLAYVNSIANATDGTKAWENITAADNAGLKDVFDVFVGSTKSSNLNFQAGSSFNIQRTVQDLYKLILNNKDALSSAIRDSIETKATVDGAGNLTFDASLNGFPQNIGLPDGAACLHWDTSEKKFEYVNTAFPEFSTFITSAGKFVYPAQLLYGVNSTILTANVSKATAYNNYSATPGDSWASFLANTYTEGLISVSTRTRSVAIKDAIQYGVGRFDVQVQLADAEELKDANPEGEKNIPITTGNGAAADGLLLTGVLVGSQGTIDYMFHPKAAAGTTGDYVIYDSIAESRNLVALKNAFCDPNYTLVYETNVPTSGEIYFALEFKNTTGKDFFGIDGKVPAGGKFYLVGKLAMSKENPAHSDGQDLGKIFQQDFYTIAKCTVNDLKKAHNTIPDLAAPQMELGLSVDLEWQQGHTFVIDSWE